MNKEKKAHGIQLLLRMVVTNPDGKVISDTGRKPANSFVIQFLEFIWGMFTAPLDLLATRTNGTEGRIYWGSKDAEDFQRVDAPINNSSYGVVVGTGDTAETNTDYKLETQLTEGVGAGRITHASVTFVAAAVVGANVDLVVKRAFINNTGSAITVKEAGIYTSSIEPAAGGPHYHCIIRDVLPGPVNVPDKCSLAVYYTLRTTV